MKEIFNKVIKIRYMSENEVKRMKNKQEINKQNVNRKEKPKIKIKSKMAKSKTLD